MFIEISDTVILELVTRQFKLHKERKQRECFNDQLEGILFYFHNATRYFQLQQAQFTDQPNLKYDPGHDWFVDYVNKIHITKDYVDEENETVCLNQIPDHWISESDSIRDSREKFGRQYMMAFEVKQWEQLFCQLPGLANEMLKIVELDAINMIKQGACSSELENHLYEFIPKLKRKKIKKLRESENREREIKNWKIPDWVEEDAIKRKQKGKSSGRKNEKKTKNQKTKQSSVNTQGSTTNGLHTAVAITKNTNNNSEIQEESVDATINVKKRNKIRSEGDWQISNREEIPVEIPEQIETENNNRENEHKPDHSKKTECIPFNMNNKSSKNSSKKITMQSPNKTTEVSKPKTFADLLRKERSLKSKEVNEVIDGMQQRCDSLKQKVLLD